MAEHLKQLYQCPVCGLHYRDKDLAVQCEEFCNKHNACNMEISKHSVERQKLQEQKA